MLRVNGVTDKLLPYEKYGIQFKVQDIDDMPDFQIESHFEEAHKFIEEGI